MTLPSPGYRLLVLRVTSHCCSVHQCASSLLPSAAAPRRQPRRLHPLQDLTPPTTSPSEDISPAPSACNRYTRWTAQHSERRGAAESSVRSPSSRSVSVSAAQCTDDCRPRHRAAVHASRTSSDDERSACYSARTRACPSSSCSRVLSLGMAIQQGAQGRHTKLKAEVESSEGNTEMWLPCFYPILATPSTSLVNISLVCTLSPAGGG